MEQHLIIGVVGGVSWAILGALSKYSKDKDNFKFKPKKFIKSVILGAGVGVVLAYQGVEVNAVTMEAFVEGSVMIAPLTAIADKANNLLWNALKPIRTKLGY